MIRDDDDLPLDDDDEEIPEDGQDAEEGLDEGSDDAALQEGDEGEEGGQEEQVEAKPSRASARVKAAVERAKAAESDKQRLEREISELRAARNAPQQETAEQEAQRLSLMTTEERVDYKLNKALGIQAAQAQRDRFENADRAEKAEFKAAAATDKHRAKYVDRVETKLTELRSQGQTVSRERLYTYLVGEDVLAGLKDAGGKQREAGKRNVQRQTVRSPSGRSDQAGSPRRGGKSLEERLSGVPL